MYKLSYNFAVSLIVQLINVVKHNNVTLKYIQIMKKQLFFFVLFLSALTLFAQPAIKFDNTTIDFGNIKEEEGKVSKNFEFTNVGDQPLLITSVKPGCGCTAADYTRTEVAPGGRGFITATYDPHNRPGSFNKSIKVTTNEPRFTEGGNVPPHSINIRGSVEKRPPSKFELAGYANSQGGDVRIKDGNVKFELFTNETKQFTIKVMNFSEETSKFELINSLPNYITMEGVKEIKAGEEVEITFKYDAAKRGEIGEYKDLVVFTTQDPNVKIPFTIDVVIREDFSKLTPKQLQDAPKAHVESMTLDFGNVTRNTTPTVELKLYNNGKNPLIIRQLKSSNSLFSVVSDKNEIPQGGFATIMVTLNSRSRRGKQNATLEILTNDPANSHIVVNCTGEVS